MQIGTTGGIYAAFFGAPNASAAQSLLYDALTQSYGGASASVAGAKSATAQLLDLNAADATGRTNFDVLSAFYGQNYSPSV